jgi:hypothetical protein
MRLFEFDVNALDIKVAIIADELKTALDSGDLPDTISTDDLISRFEENGVPVDRRQLADMIQVPPLSDVIDNMNDDEVTFKGTSADDIEFDYESDQEKVVSQMAKKAMNK